MPIKIRHLTLAVLLLLTNSCASAQYQSPIQALGDSGSPVSGADSATLSSLHILQAQNISDGKILLYFLPNSRIKMAVTRLQQTSQRWSAVASDQQELAEAGTIEGSATEKIEVFSSSLGASPSYRVIYGFCHIGDTLNRSGTLHIAWDDGSVRVQEVSYGAFLAVREGDSLIRDIWFEEADGSIHNLLSELP